MSAEIIDFVAARAVRVRRSTARAFRLGDKGLGTALAPQSDGAFLFWAGASGARYVHTVYDLFDCPPIEASNYVLVKRHDGGQRTVVLIGHASHAAASLNLAEIRQRAAQLGANEVHLHLLAGGKDESQRIEADLRRALAPV